jgi:hypothetical protein
MNRSTWLAVLATATVLAGASAASHAPWPRLGLWSERVVLEARPRLAALANGALARWERPSLVVVPSGAVPAAAAAAVLALGLATAFAIARRRHRPLHLAERLLRRGGAPSRVARRTRLPQDALRMLARGRRA